MKYGWVQDRECEFTYWLVNTENGSKTDLGAVTRLRSDTEWKGFRWTDKDESKLFKSIEAAQKWVERAQRQ